MVAKVELLSRVCVLFCVHVATNQIMEVKITIILSLFLAVLANGDLLGTIKNLWYRAHPSGGGGAATKSDKGNSDASSSDGVVSGKSFSGRSGYYDDPYMSASGGGRGWGGWGGGWGDDHQNLDLYSLLGGLSFASLLGATIIYLARRNSKMHANTSDKDKIR